MYLLYHVTCISLYPVFYVLLYVVQTFFTLVQVRHIVQFGENENSILSLKSLRWRGQPISR